MKFKVSTHLMQALGCPHGQWDKLLSMFDKAHFMGKSNALTLYLTSWERGMQNFCLPRWERRLQGTLRDKLAKHRQRLVWPWAAPYAQPPRITKSQLLLFSQKCSLRSHFRRHLNHLSYRKKDAVMSLQIPGSVQQPGIVQLYQKSQGLATINQALKLSQYSI